MKRVALGLGVLAVLVAAGMLGGLRWWWPIGPAAWPESDMLVVTETLIPDTAPVGFVFLLSDTDGSDAVDRAIAERAKATGAVVVRIDTAATLRKAEAVAGTDCVYMIGDFEDVSQQVQKRDKGTLYRDPIVAGRGTGGTFALALLAQTPDASIARTIAVDPGVELPVRRELCSDGPHEKTADGKGWVFGLPPGALPAPTEVISTPVSSLAGREHVAALVRDGHPIQVTDSPSDQGTALTAALEAALAEARQADATTLGDLPLSVLPAAGHSDTMAIVLSGDGGWRDLDRSIAEVFAARGVPTIGIDSLRYFWSEKPPERIAADIGRIVGIYGKKWHTHRIALIGYSFGADVLPAAFNAMPADLQSRIALVSLLGPSLSADFEFKLSGLLGMAGEITHPTLPEVQKMPPGIIQCVYGIEDEESLCPKLDAAKVQVIRTDGGHHFDEDYPALAGKILARLKS